MKLFIVISLTFFTLKSFSFDKSIIPKRAKSLGLVKVFEHDDTSINQIISGTSFFISKTKFITNYHIVDKAVMMTAYKSRNLGLGHITIAPFEGSKDLVFNKVKVEYISMYDDMVILEVLDKKAIEGPQVPIDLKKEKLDLRSFKKGEFMFSLGHPFYEVLQVNSQRFVELYEDKEESRVSVWSRFGNYPGFSGSPLFDKEGNLLGLMNSYSYLDKTTVDTDICSMYGTKGHGISIKKIKEHLSYYESQKEVLGFYDEIITEPFKPVYSYDFIEKINASLEFNPF